MFESSRSAQPHYAVIFSSTRTSDDDPGYLRAAARMLELASAQPGFLGFESARGPDGFGISVSYWRDRESIAAWRQHAEHLEVQRLGRERWYECFRLRVARVEGDTEWKRG